MQSRNNLQPARRLAGANAFVARDAQTSAYANFDKCAAMRAVIGLNFVELSGLGLRGTRGAPLCFRNCFQSLGRYRSATDFAQDGCLPVAEFFCQFLRWARKERLLFANRTGHLKSRVDEQRFHKFIFRLPFAAQFANDSQPRNGIIAATDGPPAAVSAREFVGNHNCTSAQKRAAWRRPS
jgi:hypothetical protein